MRIAMLGLGDIAQKAYLPVVANHTDITPVLCTRNPDVLKQCQTKYRINESYNSISDLIKSAPDAVMIHSSTESHFDIANQCLNANIPVFIDKPISYHLHECESLINLAEQKQLPIMTGFNRRYAPLYQSLFAHTPVHVRYQKNRFNLPDNTRIFIFDDFIHVLDFVRHCAGATPDNIDVFAHKQDTKLSAVQVQWQHEQSLFSASMNRINGITEERCEYFSHNEKWQIDNVASGFHYHDNEISTIGFGDWENTLFKRGFVTMINDFISRLQQGGTDTTANQSVLDSHILCEKVVNTIENNH